MSVSELVAQLHAVREQLVQALQEEYFCDDLTLPAIASGWGEEEMRSFFESGGAAPMPDSSAATAAAPPAATPAARRPGRPAIVCLGDANTEFASHMLTAASVKHEKSPPLASDVLTNVGAAAPISEQGPGWLALLRRDYDWRGTADVINRGYSGYTTRMALQDLEATLDALPVASPQDDVLAVVLNFGAADASAAGPLHVAPPEYEANLEALIRGVRAALPAARIVVVTPVVVVDGRSAGSLSLQGLRPYVAAAARLCAAGGGGADAGATLLDVHKGMSTRLMQFNDALGASGRHLSQKGNNFVYRMLKEHLGDALKIGAHTLPPHRPAAHAAAYPDGCDYDGRPRR